MKAAVLKVVLIISSLIGTSCGGGAETESAPALDTPPASEAAQPVSARVIVTDVQLSDDGETVESITVRTEDGSEVPMRLSEDIEPNIWGPPHLLGHVQTGKALGFKIGVTYVQTPDGTVATELSE